jgi:isocitrate lyase
MPKLDVSIQDEQKAFEADVATIEKQWSSATQSHLKRYVGLHQL